MTAESIYGAQIAAGEKVEDKKVHKSLFDYPAIGGHEASSEYNWVPADFMVYRLCRLLGITDEQIKKKSSG